MAMGAVQAVTGGTGSGTSANLQTPLSTETVQPADDLFLHVKNASGSPITVTLTDASTTQAGSNASNPTYSVPATTGEKFIAIPWTAMNPNTGLITVTFSSTTSVTAEWLTR